MPMTGFTLSLVVYPATISTNLLMTSSGSCLLIRALVPFDT